MSIELDLIKQAVREVLLELQQEQLPTVADLDKNASPSNKCWYPTKEAYELLGLKSAAQLLAIRRRLKVGTHYRYSNRTARFNRPTYDWHVPNCQDALAKDLLRR